ncbi:MAG TPA: molybdopterin-dependent oxidoreductase [Candidatus Acidoferrales bacterium]|jgi:DMSO/TMAO reductase YedYZ molybdopterin-dependent catalytic subunit|nr:molybdopterin-dependent oxidoreductase [Candidatus Acidoferrales bacterium]
MRRILLVVAFPLMLGISAWAQQAAPAKPSSGPTDFKISGAVTTPLDLSAADLKGMPRKTLRVENAHSKKTEVYEGVLVEDLLQKAGVPQGEQLRGPAMATYVLVEAADNYRVVFSLAEFNSSFQDSEIIVADTMDGAPIPGALGPFRLVAPHEKRPARWVEMIRSLTVVRVPN